MQPKTSKYSGKIFNENIVKNDTLACKFPGLAIPNEIVTEVNDPINDVMAELESFAPILRSKYDFITLFKSLFIILLMLYVICM